MDGGRTRLLVTSNGAQMVVATVPCETQGCASQRRRGTRSDVLEPEPKAEGVRCCRGNLIFQHTHVHLARIEEKN